MAPLGRRMPLKPLVFEILLALGDEPRHGWDLVTDVEAVWVKPLLPGNFYRTLRRLLADGLIVEAARPRGVRDSAAARRRYFQLTPPASVWRAPKRRLAALVGDRRARRLLKAR